MLRWLLYIGLGLGGLVLLVVVVGWALPLGHRAAQSRSLSASPDRVFAVIADFARATEWRVGLDRVEITGDPGPGQVVREFGQNGEMAMRVEALDPPSRLVTRIVGDNLPFGGTWTYVLAPGPDGGTVITITEDGEIYNPVFKFMARFYFGYETTMEGYLRDLARRLGEG